MLRVCKYCGAQFEGRHDQSACPDCVEARKRDVRRVKTCAACGVTFLANGPRGMYCPACRADRRLQTNKEARERAKAGKTRQIGSTDLCVLCGEPYTVTGGLQMYCPKCAPGATRAKANELSRAWNAEHFTPEARKTERKAQAAQIECPVCGKLFVPEHKRETCSAQCAEALARAHRREREKGYRAAEKAERERLEKLPKCSICGRPVEPPRKKYCSAECARAGEKITIRAWRDALKAKDPKAYAEACSSAFAKYMQGPTPEIGAARRERERERRREYEKRYTKQRIERMSAEELEAYKAKRSAICRAYRERRLAAMTDEEKQQYKERQCERQRRHLAKVAQEKQAMKGDEEEK